MGTSWPRFLVCLLSLFFILDFDTVQKLLLFITGMYVIEAEGQKKLNYENDTKNNKIKAVSVMPSNRNNPWRGHGPSYKNFNYWGANLTIPIISTRRTHYKQQHFAKF